MNSYPYKNLEGLQITGGELTGWANTDAQRQVECPVCLCGPGYQCETPKGALKRGGVPHWERVKILFDQFGRQRFRVTSGIPWRDRTTTGVRR